LSKNNNITENFGIIEVRSFTQRMPFYAPNALPVTKPTAPEMHDTQSWSENTVVFLQGVKYTSIEHL